LNTNVLVEVDGDYWHGNPKIYSKLNEIQLKQKERDIKNEQLAKENGFIVLRFWESDILNNKNIIVKELMKVKVK
jgi:very-short-patch-repair endonuclease